MLINNLNATTCCKCFKTVINGGVRVRLKRIGAVIVCILMLLLTFTACSTDFVFQDGTYTAEFEAFDSNGYKEYLIITVEDSVVSRIEYDAEDKDGNLRSEDESYRTDMEAMEGTYPSQYVRDLINQYMEKHDIQKIDIVAGATYASKNFVTLFVALEPSMSAGNETPVVVKNVNP